MWPYSWQSVLNFIITKFNRVYLVWPLWDVSLMNLKILTFNHQLWILDSLFHRLSHLKLIKNHKDFFEGNIFISLFDRCHFSDLCPTGMIIYTEVLAKPFIFELNSRRKNIYEPFSCHSISSAYNRRSFSSEIFYCVNSPHVFQELNEHFPENPYLKYVTNPSVHKLLSSTTVASQPNLSLDWLRSLCFNVPVRE